MEKKKIKTAKHRRVGTENSSVAIVLLTVADLK